MAIDLIEVWQNVLGELQVALSKANFETWFRDTFIVDYKKGFFTIGVPTFFVEDWFKKKYFKEIQKALQKQVNEPIAGIKFKIASPSLEQKIVFEKSRLVHRVVDKSFPPIKPSAIVLTQSLPKNSTLNDSYTFASFVVGSSNQIAHAAAIAIVDQPGSVYNPLYIYGDSGLGKTHLMQAIGNQFLEKNPHKCILYVTTETFVNEFVGAVQSGSAKAKDFKDRYRNVDMLLIDDIQFIGGKESTQEEFFHTFNHLQQNKKQVVLTSDRYPKDIKGLENRLKTRFEAGMVTDISAPDLETREAILQEKSKAHKIKVDQKIIRFIAENVKSSIRELEGSLIKIIATAELTKQELTLELAEETLKNMIDNTKRVITPDLIIKEIHKHYHIPIEDLLGKKRTKDVVTPRQMMMYLMRHEANLSFPEIGKEIGGRDHSTIMHGCEKIASDISENIQIKEDIAIIKEKIYQVVH